MDPLTRRARADVVARQAAEELRRMLQEVAAELDPFPYFLGSYDVQALEVEPPSGAGPDRGCVVVCPDGELYEYRVGVSPGGLWGGGLDRQEGLVKLELPPHEYVAYAFAALAYQSTWLRLRYPAEYYAALLNNQPMGFYAPHVLAGDARRHGVRFLRVSLNQSEVASSPRRGPASPALAVPHAEAGYVLLGLTTVQGLGEPLAREIVAERAARGPYRSLSDLLRRTGVTSRIAERLIVVGALGELGLARRELLWQLGLLLPDTAGSAAVAPARTKRARQLSLELPVEQDMVTLADMTEWERMLADYEFLGLSPAHHPLGLLRAGLPHDVRSAAQLRRGPDGIAVRTAGMVVCRQRPGTAKGYVFLLLEDETGLTNVVVRPDLYEERRSVVRGEPYVLVEGRLQLRSGTLNLLANQIAPLADVPGTLLPRPAERHGRPGNAHDPREAAALALVTPSSHDFH